MWRLDSSVATYTLYIRAQADIVPYGTADQGLRQLAPGGEELAQHGPAKHTPVAECPARMVMGGILLFLCGAFSAGFRPVHCAGEFLLAGFRPVVPG